MVKTPPTTFSWQDYVNQLTIPLRLVDWEVRVSDSPCDDTDDLASINPTYGQKRATIRFCEGFDGRSTEEQRKTIAHELIHCHFWPMTEMAEADIEHFMSSGEREMFSRGFRRNMEYAVDALADALAPFLPLPAK